MHLAAHKAATTAILLHVECRRYYVEVKLVYSNQCKFGFTCIDSTQCTSHLSHLKTPSIPTFPETLLSPSIVHDKLSGVAVQHDTSACICRKPVGGIWAQAASHFGDGMHHLLVC